MSAITTTQPAQADIIRLIESNPKLQPSTKKQYTKAITGYLDTGNRLTDADALGTYAQGLSKSSRAFLKAAIRLWGDEVALKAKAGATPENIGAVQATVFRIDALNEAIKVEATKGQRAHTWLTQAEVKRLMATCGDSLQGKRDRLVLGLLVGAGLRREELANLTFDDVVLQPMGNRFRTVLNVKGKGAKDRVVPISDALASLLDSWKATVGGGLVARSIGKGGAIGDSLSAVGIFHIVSNAGAAIGKPDLAPHDLRRTYAQLGYEAGVPITQISKLLGHASVATTQRYLNLELDLETTVSDFVPV
ncbi:MAG: site-specific integrase [Anaerolineae bacterium]|nr:site-specific integrase [Anaerolineae bacterium]MCB9107623.1 site-specific integrase [Anaerolineales bacterium]